MSKIAMTESECVAYAKLEADAGSPDQSVGPSPSDKITIERDTLERAIDALGPVGGSNARNAYAELRAAQPAEPVAWMVEGWHEGKLIARIPHLSLEKAKESAAVFSQHYTTTKIVLLYDAPPAPAAVPLTDGDELWLWRNGDHLLAFRHLYPCYSPGGDPMTLGEPVARAVFRSSHDRATKQEE